MKTLTFHERFVLDIDPSRRFIKGSAELTIQPLQKKLPNVRINSRQCKILRVKVNGDPAEYSYSDPVSELTLGENTTVAHHHVYKSRYLNALREADEGELVVRIPEGCIQQISDADARMISSDMYSISDLPDDTPLQNTATTSQTTPSFAPVVIRIDYELENPRNGLIFVDPDEVVAPYRYHHLYTINQPLPGATRAWLPCMDRIHDRCTWDMEFIVPNKLGALAGDYDGSGSGDMGDDEYPTVVVCSGEVVEQVAHPTDPTKKIVHYNLSAPTAAPFIGFAVGPFQMIKFTPAQFQEEVLTGTDLDESQQQSLMAEINMMSNIYAFGLPGREEELAVSCGFLMHAMHFYPQEYGSYPFHDYKLVFVEDVWCETSSSASLAICSSRLLHSGDIIDQTYQTRRVLSLALARQWFGIHIVQKSWADAWLIYGLANLMGALFIKRHLGNSEFRLRMKRDMELCCELDVNRPPLYNPALPSPLDADDLEFIELKAPLVLYMLDKRICKLGATLGMSRVIPKIRVSAISGELVQNALSTHFFLRLCRKVSGFDTKTFADQWIYRSGCPKFTFSFHFNRKKMVVEFYMRQENSNHQLLGTKNRTKSPNDMHVEGGTIDYQDMIAPLFTGNLTVRIHEADGTPYEHILDIQSNKHKFEVQFNTKYKRIRRNTKRFLAKQAAAAAAVAEEDAADKEDGEGGTTNVLGIIPALGLGMPVFEDPKQRQSWKVVEWGQDEEDTSGAASAMFDWIRLDADFEWLCTIDFQQPDYMWAGELTKDRDVVAQYEAIMALRNMPSLPTATSLLRALIDPKCFYKIRMEAAYALAKCGGEDMKWVGLHQLCKMFQSRYCFPQQDSPMEIDDDVPVTQMIPRPNNFSNFSDYFVQKGMVIAFSQVRDNHGRTPVQVRQLLLDLLKYNDNIGNEYSDSYYIATLISAVGDAFIPAKENTSDTDVDMMPVETVQDEQLLAAAVSEIERFRTLDCVIPTYHNIVTISCIKTLTKMMLNGVLEPNYKLFMQYTRYGNFVGIRLCAFDSLFVLCGLNDNKLTEYLLNVIKDDPCVDVSHYVARAMLTWLGPAMRLKSELPQNRFVEEFAEEEGRAVILDDKRHSKSKEPAEQLYIENLRKQFESNVELQDTIWKMLNTDENSMLDHSVRKHLLQFCEYMYKPADVGIKVTIRMPSLVQDIPEELSEPPTPSPPASKPAKVHKSKPPTTPKEKENGVRPEKKPALSTAVAKAERASISSPALSSPSSPATSSPGLAISSVTTTVGTPTTPAPPPPKSQPAVVPTNNESTHPTPSPAAAAPQQQAVGPSGDKAPGLNIPKITTKRPEGMTSTDFKMCKRVLSKIMRHRSALPFLQSVDEKLDGAPNYYTIIKRPMDLGTVRSKLETGVYKTFKELEDDIRLMLSNCFAYNGPGTPVYIEGQTLETALEKEIATARAKLQEKMRMEKEKAAAAAAAAAATQQQPSKGSPAPSKADASVVPSSPPAKKTQPTSSSAAQVSGSISPISSPGQPRPESLASSISPVHASSTQIPATVSPKMLEKKPERPKSDREKCALVLAKTMENKHAFEFLRPVEPNKQNIPNYFNVIKKPMDLGTIKSKLKTNQYANAEQFDDDVRLMFRNCFTYNKPNTIVHNEGKHLEQVYNQEWINYFGALRKQAVDSPRPHTPSSTSSVEKNTSTALSSSQPAKTTPKPAATIPTKAATETKPSTKKVTKPAPSPAATTITTTAATATTTTTNGTTTTSSPKPRAAIQERMDDNNMRICDRIIKKLWSMPSANAFYEPVDAEALNLPQYYEVIKRPMDLSSVRRNLEGEEFSTIWEFERDIRQIFWNCYRFNDIASWIGQQAQELEAVFNQEWRREYGDPNMLQGEEFQLVRKVVTKLRQHEASLFFNEPVDLDIFPDYTKVVKTPMDLRTISEKLESGKYTSLQQADTDIRLVFSNCCTYNKSGTYAYELGKKLEKYYNSNIGKELRQRVKNASGASANQRRTSASPAPSTSSSTTTTTTTTTTAAAKPPAKTHPSTSSKVKASAKTPAKAPSKSTKQPAPTQQQQHPANSSSSPTSPAPPAKLHPSLQSKLQSLLVKLMNNASAIAFLEPVDAVALNIPHYPLIIKNPMDLGTMDKKLRSGEYKTVKDFETDMRLIFTNCYTFNGFDHPVSQSAKVLEKIFNKEVPSLRKMEENLAHSNTSNGSAPKAKSSGGGGGASGSSKQSSSKAEGPKAEVRKYKYVLDKISQHQSYFAFAAPVDPVLLQVPTYFDVIKHPMDFGTIRNKLNRGQYPDVDAFLADVQQVFINCFTFNLPDDVVSEMGRSLETEFNKWCAVKGLKQVPISEAPPPPPPQPQPVLAAAPPPPTSGTDLSGHEMMMSHEQQQQQQEAMVPQHQPAYGLVDMPMMTGDKRSFDQFDQDNGQDFDYDMPDDFYSIKRHKLTE